ncbi:MAG: class I SAM-dependent methyltransferase [Ignavibacteriae bacterium]|nr:class I SAM-dependent methyltransferase [Ignavibacteriota bacterium]
MQNFWDERYSKEEYIYGTEPNKFLKEILTELKPGKILFPAEGEGRNSAFAAELGWEVYAFDSSKIAIEKAEKLYKIKNIKVNYSFSTLEDFTWEENYFDCIALIFVHPPENLRKIIHQNLIKYLRHGGFLILEGFSKNQIKHNSGGPRNFDVLFSEEIIKTDFGSLKEVELYSVEKEIFEGNYHNGKVSVVDLLAQKI